MATFPLRELIDQAQRVYTDPGWTALRAKDADIQELLHSKQELDIEPQLLSRVRALHLSVAFEKLTRAAALITDQEGVRVDIAKAGMSTTGERSREQTRSWCSGFERRVMGPQLEQLITADLLAHSRAVVRVQLFAAAWTALSQLRPKQTKLNLDDVHTATDVADRTADFMAESEGIEEENEEKRQQIIRRRPPIQVEHVPAQSFYWQDDAFSYLDGPRRTWEFRSYTVREVIENFLDEQGNTLATELDRQVAREELRPSDTCTVVIRCDRTSMQVFTVDFTLDQSEQSRSYRQQYGAEQLLYDKPHGLGRTPYAIFLGRLTTSEEPARRFCGLIDPGYEIFREIDNMESQFSSALAFAANPSLYIKKHHDEGSPGTGDRVADFPSDPGMTIDATGPGEELLQVPWLNADTMRLLAEDIERKKAYVDRLTFGATAYGSHSAGSGYEYNSMHSDAVSTCEPFRIGKQRGYADLFALTLRVADAAYKLDPPLPPIPVLSTLPENKAWVILRPSDAAVDWEISVTVESPNEGGELAKIQAIQQLEDRGYISHEEAIRRSGNQSPQQVMKQVAAEKLALSQEMQQAFNQALIQRMFANLAQAPAGGLPAQPMLPSALAGALGPLGGAIGARLPGQQFGQPGVSNGPALPGPQLAGLPGGPNLMTEMNPTPAPPQRAPGPPLPSLGGPGLPGQAAFAPGGVQRQDTLNALQR